MNTFKMNISFNWWKEGSEVPEEHHSFLQDAAMQRIKEMMDEGFVCGDLSAVIDEEDIQYTGWWESKVVME